MSDTSTLIKLLDATPIYAYGQGLALSIYAFVTPVLLLVAIFIRTMETQLDVIAGQGRWGLAVRDFIGWGFVISVYFGIANQVAEFMNSLYAWIGQIGSMKAITDSLAALVEGLKAKAAAEAAGDKGSIAAVVDNLASLPSQLIALGLYYVSHLFVLVLKVFFNVAHAIGYSLAVAYGLIAIPLSITKSLKLMRGWAIFMGFLLLWPLIEGFCLALFTPIFVGAANSLLLDQTLRTGDTSTAIYMLFTVLNFVVFAIILSAPFVATHLASNTSAGTGLVVPFAGAAIAAAGALAAGTRAAGGRAAGLAAGSGLAGAAASMFRSGGGAGGGEPKPRSIAPARASSSAAPPAADAPEPAPAAPDDPPRARQQRRGAIISQQRKSRPK